MFFGSLRGGRTAATLYSLVQSARLYHLDVTAYLTDTSALRDLLPDRWAVAHPGSILQARQQESHLALEHRRNRRALRRMQSTA